ncbi:MAG TPA: substrate-binding domain-containing protein, partial [Chloroflexota bacterium]
MQLSQRLEQIIRLVEATGFATVSDLARICQVTEVTIRRDLQLLEKDGRLRRTHGGAFALRGTGQVEPEPSGEPSGSASDTDSLLAGKIDALITTPVEPLLDRSILEQVHRANIPVVAESQGIDGFKTVVAVDNYQAAFELGRWSGDYANSHLGGRACVLDLTFQLPNTQARSQGFLDGLRTVVPAAELALSINAQSRRQTAYQLASDALAVHPEINIVFAINDSTTAGALQACQERGVEPDSL